VAGFCGHGVEPPGSIRTGYFLIPVSVESLIIPQITYFPTEIREYFDSLFCTLVTVLCEIISPKCPFFFRKQRTILCFIYYFVHF
jgi:hypothetical protein